ncbi:MAG: acyl carrier protein [Bacteroidales bacterium]
MKEEIIKILTEIRPEFDFTEDINFIEEGMLDSFDIVSLVDSLDEKYKISISGLDIIPENFSSIDAIVRIVEKNK